MAVDAQSPPSREARRRLMQINKRLAAANAESAELMAELEEKNARLLSTNKELARANAHAAELMAIVELKDGEIGSLNRSLLEANARAAELLADGELQMEELQNLNTELTREVRERRRAEERADHERAKLLAMIAGMDDGILFADRQDRVIEANTSFLRLVRRDRTDVVDASIWGLPLPSDMLTRCISHFRKGPGAPSQTTEIRWDSRELLLRLQPL